MLKKLRRRFVLINMLFVSVVLIIVFTVFCISSYHSLKRQYEQTLIQSVLMNKPLNKFDFGFKDKPPLDKRNDKFQPVAVFCAILNEDGTVSAIDNDSVEVTDEQMKLAVSSAQATGKEQGTLDNLDLMFVSKQTPDGVKFAFADTGLLKSSIARTVILSVCIGTGGLIAFFFISLFLAKLTVAPVEKAWIQQKQFVADASHELKTPITVILANSDILLSHCNETIESQHKWLDNTKAEALQMKKLVDDMLYLAKSDATKNLNFNFKKVNLSDVVMSSILPFEAVAFEGGVNLDENIAENISITADESQIRQLTAILLDNACKYSGKGNSVSVSLYNEKSKTILKVCNTGSYITKENTDRLFERFYRADSSRSRKSGGYGLGLSIAKSIAEIHKAKITVSSSIADGTVFKVIFPCN